jgi:transposase
VNFPEEIYILTELNHFRVSLKNRLVKFKGMNKSMFNLHLKECKFRINNRNQNIYKILFRVFRKEVP